MIAVLVILELKMIFLGRILLVCLFFRNLVHLLNKKTTDRYGVHNFLDPLYKQLQYHVQNTKSYGLIKLNGDCFSSRV